MDQHISAVREQNKTNKKYLVLLSVAGLLVNYLLAQLAIALKLPLYLDNIGSALAAALGGYLPGIIVGFMLAASLRPVKRSGKSGRRV